MQLIISFFINTRKLWKACQLALVGGGTKAVFTQGVLVQDVIRAYLTCTKIAPLDLALELVRTF